MGARDRAAHCGSGLWKGKDGFLGRSSRANLLQAPSWQTRKLSSTKQRVRSSRLLLTGIGSEARARAGLKRGVGDCTERSFGRKKHGLRMTGTRRLRAKKMRAEAWRYSGTRENGRFAANPGPGLGLETGALVG